MVQDLKASAIRILDSYGSIRGTGFVIDANTIATCAHVVEAAGAVPGGSVTIAFATSKETITADVLPHAWRSPADEDIAILYFQNKLPVGVAPVTLGPSESSIGHGFLAFGYPKLGDFEGVWAEGRILGLITDSTSKKILQLDSPQITQGMSGGPVLDRKDNRLVGMINATYIPDETFKFHDTAFAIPIETIQQVWSSIELVPPIPSRWDQIQQLPLIVILVILGLLLSVICGLNLGSNILGLQIAAIYSTATPTSTLTPTPTSTPEDTATPTSTATATPTPYPPMPNDGTFNIALVPFFRLNDESSDLIVDKDLDNLSSRLFTALKENNTVQLPGNLPVKYRGPDEMRVAFPNLSINKDSDLPITEIVNYAENNNVHLLIYGVVGRNDRGYYFQPHFYISPRISSFEYGSEVIGPNSLGQPVSLNLPISDPSAWSQNQAALYARVQVLNHIVGGLFFFYLNRTDEAIKQFTSADGEWSLNQNSVTGLEGEQQGKEVIHLLKGAAKLRNFCAAASVEDKTTLLHDARESFNQAVSINPDYARSYLGLGAVSAQQAIIDNMDQNELNEAKAYFEKAASARAQPPLSYVKEKATYGLGQINYAIYDPRNPDHASFREKAQEQFNQVILTYNQTKAPDLTLFAGHAHAIKGWLYGSTGNWREMRDEVQEGIQTLRELPNPPQDWIAVYLNWVARAELGLQQPEKALEVYCQAERIGTAIDDAHWCAISLGDWQIAQEEVKGHLPRNGTCS